MRSIEIIEQHNRHIRNMASAFHTTFESCEQDTARKAFRVMQLNTLAHWSCDGETAEAYDKRMELHLQHIYALNTPTVVVLEEVDGPRTAPPGVPTLPQRLMADCLYGGVSVAKDNEKGDETWILFRCDQAALAEEPRVIRFDASTSQCAIAAKLRIKDVGSVLVVGHHAKAGRTAENETTRIRHSVALWDEIQSMCRAPSDETTSCPQLDRVLLCGDFNAGPHSYDGKYPADWYPTVVEGLWEPAGLRSASKSFRSTEDRMTTFKWRKGALIEQCIDYVFHAPRGLRVCGALALPADKGELPEGGLPADGLWGSDHLSLAFDFCLPDDAAPS